MRNIEDLEKILIFNKTDIDKLRHIWGRFKDFLKEDNVFRTAIIMGSGWSQILSSFFKDKIIIDYKDIGLGDTNVKGHSNQLYLVKDKGLLIFGGRFHLYAGKSEFDVISPILIAYLLGAEKVILTNAAGSVNKEITPGSIVILDDVFNFTKRKIDSFFKCISSPFDYEEKKKIERVFESNDVNFFNGKYCGLVGPTYETPSEANFYKSQEIDLIGMSTVLEAEAAFLLGLRTVGISLVTNMIPLDFNYENTLSHSEVLDVANKNIHKVFNALLAYFKLEGKL